MKEVIINLVLGACLIVAIVACWSIGYQNEETLTVTVQEKWVKNEYNSSVFLVSTDKGVYKVTDLLFLGKFNSSDIYAKLEVGKTYTITTTGYRVHVLSEYKNINKVEVQ